MVLKPCHTRVGEDSAYNEAITVSRVITRNLLGGHEGEQVVWANQVWDLAQQVESDPVKHQDTLVTMLFQMEVGDSRVSDSITDLGRRIFYTTLEWHRSSSRYQAEPGAYCVAEEVSMVCQCFNKAHL